MTIDPAKVHDLQEHNQLTKSIHSKTECNYYTKAAKIAVHSTHPKKMQRISTSENQKVSGKKPKSDQSK